MPNRLAQASSPYLQQHADNPVDWYEWGQEAWDKAVAENKPVFLSVGYSSCHWCHVMAHESFEDQEIADVLNRDYISIKLDREERPDIDDIYMTAVQLATGHGGWPMSVFLTPDKKPFFAGTYFPRHSRENFPGFHTILTNLADAWREEQEDVQKKADEFAEGLVQVLERDVAPVTNRVDTALLDQAMQHFHTVFDYEDGGFGEQPKFPPHALLRYLPLYAHHRHRLPGDSASVENFVNDATHMTLLTLERMAMGGIHDIVGGGFHRYAVDNDWLLPHFEKMLYDNGQLLYSYASVAKLIEDEDLKARLTEVADQICTWLEREMTSPEGIFYSALDADSEITPGGEKEEGAYYVWSEEELESHLGDQAEEILKTFNTHEDGNFRDEATNAYTGKNILHRHELASRPEILDQLLKARQDRPAPGLDHKCICAWNGLMISGLAVHNRLDFAETAAKHWMQFAPADLPHQIVNGQPEGQAFLDDYVFLIDALLDLYEATQNEEYQNHAVNLLDHLVKEFADPKGGFHYTSSQHELLFGQTKPAMDNATPSPNGVAVRVLRRLGRTEDSLTHLSAVFGWAQRLPQAGATILAECLEHLLLAGQESLAAGKESPTELTAILDPREITVDKEGWGHTELKITVPPGHHINSHSPSAAWLTRTSINVNGVFGEAGFPDTPNGEYEGEFSLPIRLRPKAGTEEFELTLSFQLCSESECYAPQTMTFTGVVIVP